MVTTCDECGELYMSRREATACANEDRRIADWQRQEREQAGRRDDAVAIVYARAVR